MFRDTRIVPMSFKMQSTFTDISTLTSFLLVNFQGFIEKYLLTKDVS